MPKLATHNELNDQGSVDREFDNIYRQLNVSSSSTSYPTISSGSGAPSSTPSKVGDIYLDTTAKREYRAYGNSSSADWLKVPVFYSGVETVVGGAGDKTITLPFSWENGSLSIFISKATVDWVTANPTVYPGSIETSYDALTSSSYTGKQLFGHQYTTGGGGHFSDAKTVDLQGWPKSATTTTFVLNDGPVGTTVYVKYFVWA